MQQPLKILGQKKRYTLALKEVIEQFEGGDGTNILIVKVWQGKYPTGKINQKRETKIVEF